jgi:hypothetical protein
MNAEQTPSMPAAQPMRRMPGHSPAFESGYYAYANDLAQAQDCPYRGAEQMAERLEWMTGRHLARESSELEP